MNRVYKVIWSKAKHCYVVTSEIARSVTKSASSARSAGRKGAAVLAMAALLFTAGGVLGEAANIMDVTGSSEAKDVILVKKDDGTTTPITITDVDRAIKANSDGDGLVIKNTYVKKTDAKDNLKVGDDGVISKVTGNDGTTSSPVNKLVLNVDGDNPITMDDNGIKVGKNSTVIASDGVFAGGDTADAAKAALNANGSIKGAAGKFTVDANGQVTANGGVDTYGGGIQTHGGDINADSGNISGKDITALGNISGNAITGTSLSTKGGTISGGAITGTSLNTLNGEINGGDIKSGGIIIAKGKITGNGLDAGSGAVEGNSLTLKGGNLEAGSGNITTNGNIKGNNITADGTITTNNLAVTGGLETDHITLGSEPLNYTKIDKGNVTSKILATDGGVIPIAESIFNKDGSSITVRTNEGSVDSTGNSTVGGKEIIQYLGNNAVPDVKNVTRRMVRYDDGTFSMVDTAVDGKDKYSIVSQNAGERKVTVVEGTKNLNVTENLTNGIVSETNGGAGKTVTLTQGMDGTYTVVTSGTSTEEISGQKIENYKGGLATEITGNETHHVTKNQTITVTGKSSLSAADIENKASSSIWNHVGEGYNTSWKMTDGKISESIVNGTASNKENTTAEGTKRIITNGEVTGTYNQTATSNNISLKNEAGDTSFTKSESLKGEKTSVTNPNGSSTINQSAESIVNFVKNSEGTTKTEQSAVDIKNTAKNGTITNDAKIVNTITGNNTVTSDKGGTTFANKEAKTPFAEGGETGTRVNTKITGNKVETGKVLTDFAEVANNLDVKGSTTLGRDGNTTLTVNSKSTFKDTVKMEKTLEVDGESTFNNKVTITKNGLAVTGGTTTDTLKVEKTSEFGGKAAFKDDVSMGKNLSVGGNLNVDGNIETHDAVLSADSRQVVTGRQLYQTNERVDRLDNRIKKVGANAAALAALRPGDFNPDDKFSIAAGFGSYRNANAAALGLFYRPNENVLLSLGTSFGDGENMVNAGVSVKFGRGKSMAERRKEMADEVSSMRDEMRSQDERIAELEEMLKKQSELIEKLSKES